MTMLLALVKQLNGHSYILGPIESSALFDRSGCKSKCDFHERAGLEFLPLKVGPWHLCSNNLVASWTEYSRIAYPLIPRPFSPVVAVKPM